MQPTVMHSEAIRTKPGVSSAAFGVEATTALSIGYAFAVLIAFWPSVASMVGQWANSSAYHHGFLIAPAALWLIVRDPRRPTARPWPPALLAVAAGCGAWLLGRAASANIIEHVALVSLVIAGVALFHGPSAVRAWAFPLGLLYFMVPFGDFLLPGLRAATIAASFSMLEAAGISATVDGDVIATGVAKFRIADGCAGLNFLLASLIISVVFARIAIRSWPHRMAFVALAVAAALAANWLRVALVIAFTVWTDDRYAIAADHLLLGWALYGVFLIALLAIGRRMAQAPAATVDKPSATLRSDKKLAAPWRVAGAALALLIITAQSARMFIDRATTATHFTAVETVREAGAR